MAESLQNTGLTAEQTRFLIEFLRHVPESGKWVSYRDYGGVEAEAGVSYKEMMATMEELVEVGALARDGVKFRWTETGFAWALAARKGREAMAEEAQRRKEMALRRRELIGWVVSYVLGIGSALLVAYLTHAWGWNK